MIKKGDIYNRTVRIGGGEKLGRGSSDAFSDRIVVKTRIDRINRRVRQTIFGFIMVAWERE